MADAARFAQDVEERQVAMFASFVGQGNHTTFAALGRASGVPSASLRNYAGGAAMPVHVLLALSRHLPAEAINMLTEPAGKRLVDAERDAVNWDAVAAESAGLTFEICDARADGSIDHVERSRLRRRARTLAAQLSNLAEEG